MKITTNTLAKQTNMFDKELRAILLHDLRRFQQAQGRFLRNSGETKLTVKAA